MDHHSTNDSTENISENPLFIVWHLDLKPENSTRPAPAVLLWPTTGKWLQCLYHLFNFIIKYTVLQRYHLFNLDSKVTILKSYNNLFNSYLFWMELHSSNNIFYFRLI